MRLNKTAGLVVGALIVGLSIPSLASSSTNTGRQITACVDWDTKEVRYSKNWTKCPPRTTPISLGAEGPAGPQGPKGETGPAGPQGLPGPQGPGDVLVGETRENSYPWGSLSSCSQQLLSALNSGYRISFKQDRQAFERSTGCTVEEIRDSALISKLSQTGLPVIVDWEFVGIEGGEGGDVLLPNGDTLMYAANWDIKYKVKIENYDAISPLGAVNGLCTFRRGPMENLGNGEFLGTFALYADLAGAFTVLEIGYSSRWGCRAFTNQLYWGMSSITIWEDPEFLKQNVPGTIQLTEFWGW